MKVSVIICTYNPVDHIFERVLECLRVAIENQSVYEVIIIDNNSDFPVGKMPSFIDFQSELQVCRLIIEEKQGLTYARLRGIRESEGDLLIFVDDDNLLAPDFLQNAIAVAIKYPIIGVFSGNVDLEFEVKPPRYIDRYKGLLVHRECKVDLWSNDPNSGRSMPAGAGLCVRREVANYYVHLHETGKREFILDRSAGNLMSAGDNDIALCACDIKLGMGVFESLALKHYIPKGRLDKTYLLKLVYGIYYSGDVLNYLRGKQIKNDDWKEKIRRLVNNLRYRGFQASVYKTGLKAQADAKKWAIENRI
jgi:glycosyltransferase involved in cell wall biosynthesis